MRHRSILSVAASFGVAALTALASASVAGEDLPPKAAGPTELKLLPPAGQEVPLRVFATSDARGYIEPCGCERGQFGGLPRRGTLFRDARRPQDLAIDLGNFAAGQRPLDRLRLRYMLEGLDLLRYDVLVPGEGELALGEDFEKAAAMLKTAKVVSANLILADGGKPVFEAWAVKDLPDGRKLAVVGLTSSYQNVPPRYRVITPEEALRRALQDLKGKVSAVVVATHLEGKPALELAATFPDVALVLVGRVPKGSTDLLRRGGAPTMFVGEYAQYVAWVDLAAGFTATRGGQVWLGDEVSDEPALAALLAKHKAEATAMGPELAREALAAFRAEGRVGTASCKACHAAEHAAWAVSPHAWAMRTLHEKKEQRNPECMKCHLQDLPSTASVEEVADVEGVGCEACHGPARRHAEYAKEKSAPIPLRLMQLDAGTSCVKCHDGVHSKRFDFKSYWEKVRHGQQHKEGGR